MVITSTTYSTAPEPLRSLPLERQGLNTSSSLVEVEVVAVTPHKDTMLRKAEAEAEAGILPLLEWLFQLRVEVAAMVHIRSLWVQGVRLGREQQPLIMAVTVAIRW
jgi:hypothetical protein